ncbi:MAG: polysaccharide deacetylase family protein [Terracidiphilus sp.]
MLTPFETGLCAGLGAAGLVGLAAGGFAYASLWPASTLFGRALVAPPHPGELALTFDDGPNPKWTPRLLDVLAEHNVRATFFMLGSFAQAEPDLARRVAAAGHLVGNHSWSHPNLSRVSSARIRQELARTSAMLEQILGVPVCYFRPPYGARRPAVFRIACELGLQPVLWNAMTADWREPSAGRIAARLTARIESLTQRGRSANIVLHDGNRRDRHGNRGPSVAAAAMLAARYEDRCQFVTLDAWGT